MQPDGGDPEGPARTRTESSTIEGATKYIRGKVPERTHSRHIFGHDHHRGGSPAGARPGEPHGAPPPRLKVASESRRARSAGPTPFTRSRAWRHPNGPLAVRSATMRFARDGPIPGSFSISSAGATSRSTRIAEFGVLVADRRPGRTRGPCEESTAAICASSVVVLSAGGRFERHSRVPAPRMANAARNKSARRSPCVAMEKRYDAIAHNQ